MPRREDPLLSEEEKEAMGGPAGQYLNAATQSRSE